MCHQDFQALPAKPTTLAGTFRPTAMAWWYAMIHDDVRTELQNRIVDLSQWIWVICTWMISYLMNRVSFVDSSATNGPMEFDSTIAMPQDISHQSNIGPATDLMCKIYTIYIYNIDIYMATYGSSKPGKSFRDLFVLGNVCWFYHQHSNAANHLCQAFVILCPLPSSLFVTMILKTRLLSPNDDKTVGLFTSHL